MTTSVYSIRARDYEHGGAASRAIKEQLKRIGADPAVVRRAMIAAYEAEMNVVIHAQGGELRAELGNERLDIEVSDKGPGIADIARALTPGYSTAPAEARELGFGAGMGLPNIRKNSDHFEIDSAVGRGTSIRFTVYLRPQSLYGNGRHSIRILADRCRRSSRCVTTCPTQALRTLRGRPEILDYLCVDCAACIAVCPSGTLTIAGSDSAGPVASGQPDDRPPGLTACGSLVLPAPIWAQFGPDVSTGTLSGVLHDSGCESVHISALAEQALREAVNSYAAAAPARPVVSPACPAVVGLIQTRFPSLIPHLAPYEPPLAAIQTALVGQSLTFVILCPAQRSALLEHAEATGSPSPQMITPVEFRARVAPALSARKTLAEAKCGAVPQPAHVTVAPASAGSLEITGMRHVLAALEALENGLLPDINVLEPWACDAGCFGSPLLTEDGFIAANRWARRADTPGGPAAVVRRTRPYQPRRGLRLDGDMGRAVQKLARIDRMRQTLPGSDCGWCGAPTCAALAEDIVLGRALADACVRQHPPGPAGANIPPGTGAGGEGPQ